MIGAKLSSYVVRRVQRIATGRPGVQPSLDQLDRVSPILVS